MVVNVSCVEGDVWLWYLGEWWKVCVGVVSVWVVCVWHCVVVVVVVVRWLCGCGGQVVVV